MKIWVVIGYSDYYPSPDNALGYHLKESDAKARWKQEMFYRDYDHYEYFEVEVE